jgi:hypothetical protein
LECYTALGYPFVDGCSHRYSGHFVKKDNFATEVQIIIRTFAANKEKRDG